MYPKDDIWDDEEFNTSPWFGTDDYYGTGGAAILEV